MASSTGAGSKIRNAKLVSPDPGFTSVPFLGSGCTRYLSGHRI
jgi:hypothetical protein